MTGGYLERLLEQATPGPWRANGKRVTEQPHRSLIAEVSPYYGSEADAALIARAPDTTRLLIHMAEAMVELESIAHPVTGSDHDFLYDDVPALLARFAELDTEDTP